MLPCSGPSNMPSLCATSWNKTSWRKVKRLLPGMFNRTGCARYSSLVAG